MNSKPQVLEPQPALHVTTPLVQAPAIGATGPRVWYKLENLQASGSFKDRGILHLCQTHHARLSPQGILPHFISSSGGNAGLAAANAAARLNCPVTVFVPTSTPAFVRAKLAGTGATVLVHGDVWAEANARALEYLQELGDRGVFVHPFEDELIWTGHASVVHEVNAQLGERVPNVLVCSVGGGGLLSGVCQGIREVVAHCERNGQHQRAQRWKQVKVIAVETHGADCLAQSVVRRELVTLPAITSIAKSLGASRPAERAFQYAMDSDGVGFPMVETMVVSDEEAVHACRRFADDMRFLVEPACGAALAGTAKYSQKHAEENNDVDVVSIVCGGSVIKLDMLTRSLA